MASIRQEIIRVLTLKIFQKRYKRFEYLKKTGKKIKDLPKLQRKKFWQIVATTEAEAKSGLFSQSGELFIFKPSEPQSLTLLWKRLSEIYLPENQEDIWNNPYIGVRKALTQLKWTIPRIPPDKILEITKTGEVYDQSTGEVKSVVYRPFMQFIESIWIPKYIMSGASKNGLFSRIEQVRAIANIFLLSIDFDSKSKDWFRLKKTDLSAIGEQKSAIAEEKTEVDEKIFKELARKVLELREHGKINWNEVTKLLHHYGFGSKSNEFTERLRTYFSSL